MHVTRRACLQTMAAALAAFVLPVPRRRLDLMSFCTQRLGKYDLSLPYCIDDWTYATDAHVCVRVRPESGDRVQRHGKIPPFESLSWNHDQLCGWRPIGRPVVLDADDTDCPICEGTGYTPAYIAAECETCGGTGHEWVRSWDISHPMTCRVCRGRGHNVPMDCVECPTCHGNAIGRFPAFVEIGGQYFDARLVAKAQTIDAEYVLDNWHGIPASPMLKLRFDGGDGLLMGMDPGGARRRLGGGS